MIITFGNVTIWNTATTGIYHRWSPGSILPDTLEVESPLGTGFWLKPKGKTIATHTLELGWLASNEVAIKNIIENNAASNTSLNTLTIPERGSFPNCRISAIGEWTAFKSNNGNYVIQTTITFTQYP